MRIVYAGTPPFAERALLALLGTKHEIVLVLTQPDRPAGRGMKLAVSPVKKLALERGLTVYQPPTLRDPVALDRLRGAKPDVLVVAAYGLILPQPVLDLPRLGAVNIHASLLPRWRGAAPIQRAILAGDRRTGISIMQMDAGLDTGGILAQGEVPIGEEDTAQTLHDRLAALGADMLVSTLVEMEGGHAPVRPQPVEGVTYAAKISKEEAQLDWRKPAADLDRAVRAFNPFPGAQATLGDTTLKIWQARKSEANGAPGQILGLDNQGIVVACGEGSLTLLELQRPGAKRLVAADFLRGHGLVSGAAFALPA